MKLNVKFRICILGSGFGGISTLSGLKKLLGNNTNVEIFLISNSNHFLFTPLLHEVATGGIEPENIIYPIKRLEKELGNFSFKYEIVLNLNLDKKKIITEKRSISYDYLVIALGSAVNFYGNDTIEQNSLKLKDINDAVEIKKHIETVLSESNRENDKDRKKSLNTFVIAGGGATGVELTGELVFFIREKIKKLNTKPEEIKVYLLESNNYLLPEMKSKQCSDIALKRLTETGAEVLLNHKVLDYDGNTIKILNLDSNSEFHIQADTFVWSAGVKTNPVIEKIDVKKDMKGRIIVDKYLNLPDYPGVFAIGDNACTEGGNYLTTAQTAEQQGENVAYNLYSKTELFRFSKPFKYFHYGMLVNIGPKFGISDLPGFKITGYPAWLTWKLVHLAKVMGTGNKLGIFYSWLKMLSDKYRLT